MKKIKIIVSCLLVVVLLAVSITPVFAIRLSEAGQRLYHEVLEVRDHYFGFTAHHGFYSDL